MVESTMEFIQTRSNFTIRKLEPELRSAERFLLLNQVLQNLQLFLENNDTEGYLSQKRNIERLQLAPDEPFYGLINLAMRNLDTLTTAYDSMF